MPSPSRDRTTCASISNLAGRDSAPSIGTLGWTSISTEFVEEMNNRSLPSVLNPLCPPGFIRQAAPGNLPEKTVPNLSSGKSKNAPDALHADFGKRVGLNSSMIDAFPRGSLPMIARQHEGLGQSAIQNDPWHSGRCFPLAEGVDIRQHSISTKIRLLQSQQPNVYTFHDKKILIIQLLLSIFKRTKTILQFINLTLLY
jgi:hypothetical protein